jgi:lipopolysaccharide transport system ATP-binding protein
MSNIAIKCSGISKRYKVGEAEGYRILRDVIADTATAPFRKLRALGRNGAQSNNGHALTDVGARSTIWALDDVSFEIERGQVVGMIGRNGAGKSTLLKILSRITKPTKGQAVIHGRVGSLLEIGTGFHPELTGRENIYLNGAILGMRKTEIQRKFDEIVAFAEVEKFIDTPVKRYSSGMSVRLAFSVAAHLEPEVLLVDEVLAVGDFAFQEKCLGRMRGLGQEGRTIILVTHNVQVLPRLCHKVIHIDGGRIKHLGHPRDVIESYISQSKLAKTEWRRDAPPNPDSVTIQSVKAFGKAGLENEFPADTPFYIDVNYEVTAPNVRSRIILEILTSDGVTVMTTTDCDVNDGVDTDRLLGNHTVRCEFPGRLLAPGHYHVNVAASCTGRVAWDRVSHAVAFSISNVGSLNLIDRRSGIVAPILKWQMQPVHVGIN